MSMYFLERSPRRRVLLPGVVTESEVDACCRERGNSLEERPKGFNRIDVIFFPDQSRGAIERRMGVLRGSRQDPSGTPEHKIVVAAGQREIETFARKTDIVGV